MKAEHEAVAKEREQARQQLEDCGGAEQVTKLKEKLIGKKSILNFLKNKPF